MEARAMTFSILVADPPWKFGDSLPGNGRGASKHYPCMTDEAICRFPLPPLADDALLFLWRVASKQEAALMVVRVWGFTVKSEIVWVKSKMPPQVQLGMGRYVRNSHETCLVCARGKATRLIDNHSIPSVIFAPRTKHSAKPDVFYQLVDALTGGVPTVELFARRQWPGWECLGDEMARAAE